MSGVEHNTENDAIAYPCPWISTLGEHDPHYWQSGLTGGPPGPIPMLSLFCDGKPSRVIPPGADRT